MAKLTELELAIRIGGKVDNSLAVAIAQANGQVSGLAKTMGVIGRVGLAAMAAVGTGLAAGLVKCTNEAKTLESQMAPVVRYVDGLADSAGAVSDAMAENDKTFKENYDAMKTRIQDLSTEIPRTTEQIAAMSAALGQSGKGAEIQLTTTILRDTAVAATAMDLEDKQAGDYMAKWEESFNFSHDQVMDLMDQINYLGANNATTAGEIAQSVNASAAMGQLAGVDPAATAAMATAMQATGVATEKVGTSIARIYTNISKGASATKAQKMMWQELGFTAEGIAKSMQEDGVGTLQEVFSAIQNMPEERKIAALSTLFGQWAIQGGSKIVNNLDLYKKTLEEVSDPAKYKGSMEREFIIQASTSESLDMMQGNAMSALMQDVGEAFLPVRKELALLSIDMMNGIRDNLPELTNLANSLLPLISDGAEEIGNNVQKALPHIQEAIDYLAEHGDKVLKIVGGIAAVFAGMAFAPGIETAFGLLSGLLPGENDAGGGRKSGGAKKGGGNYNLMQGIAGAAGKITEAKKNGGLLNMAKNAAAGSPIGQYFGGIRSAAGKVANTAIGGKLVGFGKGIAASSGLTGIAGGAAGAAKSGAGWVAGKAGTVAATVANSGVGKAVGGVGKAVGGVAGKVGALGSFGKAGAGLLGSIWSPAASGFMTLFTGAAPVIGIISGIIAVVSILGDHMEDIRGIIGKVFGKEGLAVFDGFTGIVKGVVDTITAAFSQENLSSIQENIRGLFGDDAANAFGGLVTIGQSVIGVVQQIVNFANTYVKPVVETIFGFITGTVLPGILNAFTTAAPFISGIITNLGSAVMGGMEIIGTAIQTVLPIVGKIVEVFLNVGSVALPALLGGVEAITEGIMGVVESIQTVLGGLIDFITGVFTLDWEKAWEGVKKIFSGIFDGLAKIVETPINAICGLINGAIEGVKNLKGESETVKIPEWKAPTTNGVAASVPTNFETLPKFGGMRPFATGGFTNGPSIAGENGTEAVISFDPAYRSANIATWQKAGRMLGGGTEIKSVENAPAGAGFTFSPQITIQGNADKQEVKAALEEGYQQFVRYMERFDRTRRRTAY